MFIIFDKINLKIHKFRQNFDDATRSERRRAIARWKALTFLQNISANQRDRIPRRDARRAQTRKLTFFIFIFEITCTSTLYEISTVLVKYVKTIVLVVTSSTIVNQKSTSAPKSMTPT